MRIKKLEVNGFRCLVNITITLKIEIDNCVFEKKYEKDEEKGNFHGSKNIPHSGCPSGFEIQPL